MAIDLPEGIYSGFSAYGDDILSPNIVAIGEHWSSPKLPTSTKNNPNWSCQIQLQGEVELKIQGCSVTVSNGQFLLIPPNTEITRNRQKHTYSHCLWIGFHLECDSAFQRLLVDFLYLIQEYDPSLRYLVSVIANEHLSPRPMSRRIVEHSFNAFTCFVRALLEEAREETSSQSPLRVSGQNTHVLNAMDILDREYSEDWNLDRLTERLSTSHSTLLKVFRESLGETPISYLWKLRLVKAHELLLNSSFNLTEIALMVGFGNSQSFSAAFKRLFGVSPIKVRKKETSIPPACSYLPKPR